MAKTEQVTLTVDMHPLPSQYPLLDELIDATGFTYNWTLDKLVARKYVITEENMYRSIDERIRPAWSKVKPEGLCPMCMMRYTIREACHNWLDHGMDKELVPLLKLMHADRFYVPASGHLITEHGVHVQGVGRVPLDPVELPGRLHLVIGHKTLDGWKAELRTAPA